MNSERITNLETLIAQGEQLERNGYPTGMMNQINRELLRAERERKI